MRRPRYILAVFALSVLINVFLMKLALNRHPQDSLVPKSGKFSGLDRTVMDVIEKLTEMFSPNSTFTGELQVGTLKIYIYDLPPVFNKGQLKLNSLHPPKIWDPNCTTNFYSAEVTLHQYLLRSPFRTSDPWKADLFYVPVYSCCHLINNHPNNLTKTGLFHQKVFDHIRTQYPFFNLSSGRDHVWAFTQGFGAQLFGDWRQIRSSIFLVHNGQFTLDEFTPRKDITIPPDLNGYNFSSVYELPPSRRPERKWLAHFGGTVLSINVTDERGSHYSKGIRQYVKKHFASDPDFRITGTRVSSYVHDMMSSTFCLCPEGWHAWNPRPYQAVLLGCIPVLLTEELELAFEEVLDYSKFIIRVKPRDVSRLKEILMKIPATEIESLRREGKRVWRLFKYGPQGLAGEAIMEMLARRRSTYSMRRYYHPF